MIAGEAGIDHIMNWVYVSEDSSTHDFLKGGELIITTGINCQDEASLYDFIETMIKSHTCGFMKGSVTLQIREAFIYWRSMENQTMFIFCWKQIL